MFIVSFLRDALLMLSFFGWRSWCCKVYRQSCKCASHILCGWDVKLRELINLLLELLSFFICLLKWLFFWRLFACFSGWVIAGACSYLAACLRCQAYAWWWYEETSLLLLLLTLWVLWLQLLNLFSSVFLVLIMYQIGCWRVEWIFAFASPIRRS